MEGMMLELSDLDDVRRFSKVFSSKYDQVNYVVMNGGQPPLLNMLGYEGSGISKQGYDMLFAGNYLGHFLLFQELLPTLLKSSPARATATSSISHWVHDSQIANLLPELQKEAKSSTWAKVQQYGNTKLLQVMMCFEAQRRLAEQGLAGHLTVTPVTPGCVNTAITNLRVRDGTGARNPLAKSAAEGAATTLYALLSAENEGATGVFVQPFWSPKHRSPPLLGGVDVNFGFEVLGQRFTWGVYRWLAHPDAYAAAFSRELWDASMQATAAQPVL